MVATFDFRYKNALNASSIPLKINVTVGDMFSNGELLPMSNSLSFAAGVAAYGMLIRESSFKGSATFKMAYDLVKSSLSYDPHNYRAEFLSIIKSVME